MNIKQVLKITAIAAISVAIVAGAVWSGRSRSVAVEEGEEEDKTFYFTNEAGDDVMAPEEKCFTFPELIPAGLRKNTVEIGDLTWKPVCKDWEIQPQLRVAGSLGSGAYGQVLVAFDDRGREVVVKTISKTATAFRGEDFVRQESEVMASLKHPNITRLLATFENEGHVGLVMTRARFGSVKKLLNRNDGWLEESLVAKVVSSASRGLLSMHQGGVIHRDVKPDNLLIFSWKPLLVQLCDFGEAQRRGMEDEYMGGTEGYSSPEYLSGESTGPWIDVWSLGVTLYELLFGYLPFPEGDAGDGSIYFDDRDVSDSVQDLLLRMLNLDVDQRIDVNGVLQHPWVLQHCKK